MMTANMREELPTDVQALRAAVIDAGGNPNAASFNNGLLKARQKARSEFAAAQHREREALPAFYRNAGTWIMRGVQLIATFMFAVIILLGVVAGTVVLVVAEVIAVRAGFDTIDPQYSMLYSIASVGFLLVLLLIRETLIGKVEDEPTRVFSLVYVRRWLSYFFGIGKGWRDQYTQHRNMLTQIDGAIRLLMWTIVLFGLLGRLSMKFTEIDAMNWFAGLRHIIEASSLRDMMSYIGATVMTAALLLGTHFIIHFIHEVYQRVTGGLEISFLSTTSVDDYIQQAEIVYLQTEYLRLTAPPRQLTEAPPETLS